MQCFIKKTYLYLPALFNLLHIINLNDMHTQKKVNPLRLTAKTRHNLVGFGLFEVGAWQVMPE